MNLVYLSPSVHKEMQEIKTEIVLSMNGIVAESLTNQGLIYKRNYGVLTSRLSEIARKHTRNSQLAEAMWYSGEREFMLLACMLQPIEEFSLLSARKWLQKVNNVELAEQLSFHLLSRLPFADETADYALQQEDVWTKMLALYILPRITSCLDKHACERFLTHVLPLLDTPHLPLFHAAVNVVQHFCEANHTLAQYCWQRLEIKQHNERQTYLKSILESFCDEIS